MLLSMLTFFEKVRLASLADAHLGNYSKDYSLADFYFEASVECRL